MGLRAHFLLFFFGRKRCSRKKAVQDLIPPLSKYIHMCTLYTYTNTICRDSVHLDSSGPPGVSSQPLGSHPSTPCAVCHGVCLYTHTYTNIHSNPRQKIEETETTHEQHNFFEECSPSPHPSPAAPTAALSASQACHAMHGVQIQVLRRHRVWLPRAAIKSRHHDSLPKGHIHECGLCGSSRVSSPSSCYSSMYCHMDMLSVYASAD